MSNVITPAVETVEMPIRAKHLAAKFNLKPTTLRRILRNMPEYADGVHTNYRWAEKDPRIGRIEAAVKQARTEREAKAKAAKEALDARVKAAAKAAEPVKA